MRRDAHSYDRGMTPPLNELSRDEQKMLLEAAQEHMKHDLVLRKKVHAAIVTLFLQERPQLADKELKDYREVQSALEDPNALKGAQRDLEAFMASMDHPLPEEEEPASEAPYDS